MFFQVAKGRQLNQINSTHKVFRDQVTKKPENLNDAIKQNGFINNTITTSIAMSNIQPLNDIQLDPFSFEDMIVENSDEEEDRVQELSDDDVEDINESIDLVAVTNSTYIVVDDYETIQQQKETLEKQKQNTLSHHLNRADVKLKVGKFFDSHNDYKMAETLARELGANNATMARILIGKGKTAFKLGDVKLAFNVLHESLHFFVYPEAEFLLKEVEKMAYFESLIDPTYNMVHQNLNRYELENGTLTAIQHTSPNGFVLASTVRLNMPTPKLITQHKYKPSKNSNSWQETYLLYNRAKHQMMENAIKS